MEKELETPENAHKLKDDEAHALLWLYICTLENSLQKVLIVLSVCQCCNMVLDLVGYRTIFMPEMNDIGFNKNMQKVSFAFTKVLHLVNIEKNNWKLYLSLSWFI